jgi:N-glycosidase YbiA
MTAAITSFSKDFFFLSNFYPTLITFEGQPYPTVEHAFQAAKTHDPAERLRVAAAASPAAAKQLGRKVTLRPDWETIKSELMLGLLRGKFTDSALQALLLGTGDAELIEGNTWNDRIWGAVQREGKWVGQNRLGKLLMQVRAEFAAKP